VAALGYFVDIYDLILYNIIKKASLIAIGINPTDFKIYDAFLFRWQMGGMLVGGIIWGILGDKLGRIKVLFGSILLYSLANIANAYVWNIPSYAVIRFIAGIGLAGELGAGITLIAETMKKEKRGYGTMIIVTFGALGAVFAYFVADLFNNWQISYWVGGIMGLALLLLRISTYESGLFHQLKQQKHLKRGDFFSLFTNSKRLTRYLACIAMGLPVWFVVGVLINLSESYFENVLNLYGDIKIADSVMFCYVGLSLGDFLSGLMSQIFKTRLKVVLVYLIFCALFSWIYLHHLGGSHVHFFYTLCVLLGAATGYWALFITIAAEQFGTNIRSTVTSTVPNFVRGAVIPITYCFEELARHESYGPVAAAIIVGSVCIGLAIISVFILKDTFARDLNFVEE
jgi:MFS family permease